jgi:hypothetical protein
MAKFGKYKADGSVEREATECALTGAGVSVEDGSVRENVKGTPYFYRVSGSQYDNLTDEHRVLLTQQAKVEPDAKWERLDLSKLHVTDKSPVTTVVKTVKASEVKE